MTDAPFSGEGAEPDACSGARSVRPFATRTVAKRGRIASPVNISRARRVVSLGLAGEPWQRRHGYRFIGALGSAVGVAVDGTVRHYVGGVGAVRSMNLAHGYAARSGARAEFDERAPIMHPVLSGTNEVRASPGRSLSA